MISGFLPEKEVKSPNSLVRPAWSSPTKSKKVPGKGEGDGHGIGLMRCDWCCFGFLRHGRSFLFRAALFLMLYSGLLSESKTATLL